jgi:hypothetical protein
VTESEIDVAPATGGIPVRTLKQVEPAGVDSAGAAQDDLARHQQVISLADRRGDLDESVQDLILGELRLIRETLELISLKLS